MFTHFLNTKRQTFSGTEQRFTWTLKLNLQTSLFCRVKFNYKCLTKMRHDKCVIDLVYAIEGLITWRISARAEVSARVTGLKKNAITWEISARAETECEGEKRCFLYLLLYTQVLRMRL